MLRQRLYEYTLGILTIAVWLTGCDSNRTERNLKSANFNSNEPFTVNVFQIQREKKFSEPSVYFGKLSPKRQSRLGFRQSGTVKNVFKQIGETAAQGEKLAELEQSQLENQRQQLEQSIAAIERDAQSLTQRQLEDQRGLRGSLAQIELELANGSIVAPFDCLIVELEVRAGDLTTPANFAFEVVENSAAIIELELPYRIADNLAIDQSVWVTVKEAVFGAVIKTRSPIVSEVGNKRLILEIIGDSENVTTNMFGQIVKIRFLTEVPADGCWIPQSALVGEANGLWSVLSVKPSETDPPDNASAPTAVVTKDLIKIVSSQDDWAYVQVPIEFGDGQWIIADGTHRVVAGQLVKPNDITTTFSIPGRGDGQ